MSPTGGRSGRGTTRSPPTTPPSGRRAADWPSSRPRWPPICRPARALDAGCGSGGPVTAEFAGDGRDVVGLDLSPGQLRLLGTTRPTARRIQGDLTALPFAADTFDALASAHAVIHVPRERHADVFAEFARVLRPGGEGLLVVGADAWEGHTSDWLGTGTGMAWSFYGRDRNLALLRDAGFEIRGDEVIDDELGGSFCAVRARLPRP